MRSKPGPAAPRAVRPASTKASGAADAERLATRLEPAVTGLGMDLDGVRVTSAGRRRLLRVTVDADGGVSLDDIEKVSRALSAVLDESAVMGEMPYTLEVSSPGVDRPLTEPRHWRRAAGRLVTVAVTRPEPEPGGQPPQERPGGYGGAGRPGGPGGAGRPGGPGESASVHGRIRQADARGVTLEIDGDARQFSYGELGPGRIEIEFGRLDEPDSADEGTDEEEPDGY
jgi:ribosome maturation factor RimP